MHHRHRLFYTSQLHTNCSFGISRLRTQNEHSCSLASRWIPATKPKWSNLNGSLSNQGSFGVALPWFPECNYSIIVIQFTMPIQWLNHHFDNENRCCTKKFSYNKLYQYNNKVISIKKPYVILLVLVLWCDVLTT